MDHPRHFTLEEVRRLRPWVSARVRLLRVARARLVNSGTGVMGATLTSATGGSWPGRDHAEAAVWFSLVLEQLEERAIIVRDLDRGLVDFPTLHEGEECYVSWLVDEPEIRRWYDAASGRRPPRSS
jgi:hypothetical protein